MQVGELSAGTPAGCDPATTLAEAAAVMGDFTGNAERLYKNFMAAAS